MNSKLQTLPPLDPPFTLDTQLNAEPIASLIPGEYIPVADASDFLHTSLTQRKANSIYKHLWFAGTPGNFRSVHEQTVFRRTIIISEHPHLHLVVFGDAIYMKPLPPCLTNHEFFKHHISKEKDLFRLACGFLYSYIHLISHESDFRIAIKQGLLRDKTMKWEDWQKFRLSLDDYLSKHHYFIDKRYRYGEFRLSRLNVIYSLKFFRPAGYHNSYMRYAPYFSRYFGAAILVFAFASVTLEAMQVALQAPLQGIPETFFTTCYRFAIAILVAVVVLIVLMIAIFIPIVFYDLRSGIIANKKMAKKLRGRSQSQP
jgi:hypothetical protein